MKRISILVIFILLSYTKGFSQRGGFSETSLFLGSNFLKTDSKMSQANIDISIGYAFSEKLRFGLMLPVGFISFKDGGQNNNSFYTALGISGNFQFFNDEIIVLHSDTRLVIGAPSREELSGWGFTRIGTEFQLYFLTLATQKSKPYIAVGANAIYGLYEKNNIEKSRTYFMPHISAGIVTNF